MDPNHLPPGATDPSKGPPPPRPLVEEQRQRFGAPPQPVGVFPPPGYPMPPGTPPAPFAPPPGYPMPPDETPAPPPARSPFAAAGAPPAYPPPHLGEGAHPPVPKPAGRPDEAPAPGLPGPAPATAPPADPWAHLKGAQPFSPSKPPAGPPAEQPPSGAQPPPGSVVPAPSQQPPPLAGAPAPPKQPPMADSRPPAVQGPPLMQRHGGPPPPPGGPNQPPLPPGMPPGAGEGPPPPPHPPGGPPPPGGPKPPMGVMRELRVEDALLYLDDVKREFRNQPGVYNEFLTIMKNFKTQAVDTPGVIMRVSKLFRGYNKLILGFNTFLPEGYKISLADLQRREAEMQAADERERRELEQRQKQAAMQKLHEQPGAKEPSRPPPASPGFKAAAMPPAASPAHKGPTPMTGVETQGPEGELKPPAQDKPGAGSPGKQQSLLRPKPRPAQKKPPQPPPPQQQHQAVEFDHAISYVTQIKRRFANDPNTYHSFLEILHTYQKEQRGIKEVLEQVAHLFQDHPDLLKEFTFFLPDAVQEQAKERLHRAAAESETRLAREREAQLERYHRQQQQPSDVVAGSPQQLIDMTARNRGLVEAAQSTPGVAAAVAAATSSGRKRPLEGHIAPTSQPETFVYNSAVERQFFDLTKEALSNYARDGGQAWAEFMKCLDMYAQEILSRNEMLNFVEPLLGKRNAKLFEEFKRILAAAGATSGPAPPLEDAWYSVPLSEIDFSRCRRCTLSYRALPRDYPAPPCSDRSEAESKVLNDVWVSLPVGSEESYTFRHMRRNTYEEILFRVEDERFEIDMVIDSNAATLQRLMPFADEITRLSAEEVAVEELGLKATNEGAGIAGKRFQYTFDKTVLGVIHRNTITRIYGDSGPEMLDLLEKNPAVAIPIVVQRLKQKDKEWKRIRDRLNVQWRELAEANYYKSLDHRSLTWRTTDKRATSTRTLLSEIKDRSQHRGKEGKEALRQKLEKAKEEHGLFFEITMKDTLSQDLDLTFLPKPDRLLFTPHLSVLYENNSWAQRDAYRILAFALERGTTSPHDKERCHRLWSEFLGPFFSLSLNWMHAPAVAYQESTPDGSKKLIAAPPVVVSEEEEDDSLEDEDVSGRGVVTEEMDTGKAKDADQLNDYHPLPTGSSVCTLYGEGIVKDFRRATQMYVVELPFGTAYLRCSTVLCSLLPAEKSNYTKQLRSEDRSRLGRPTDHLAIGTQSLFLVFRLHQILVSRLNIAMELAHKVGEDKTLCTLVEQMPDLNPKAAARRRYEAYLALVYALLDGGVGGAAEGGKYEDRVRSLLGHGAYELATMDKLISHIWKNLQSVAQDETMWNMIQLYRRHLDAGSFQPEAFRQEAALLSDHEPMYAFQWCPIQGQDKGVLHFEYLGDIAEDEEDEEMPANEDEVMAEAEPPAEPNHKRPRRQ